METAMRIDGLGLANYETETDNIRAGGTFNAAALSDVVTLGSVNDFFGDEPKRNSLLAGEGSIDDIKAQADVLQDNLTALFNRMDTGSVTRLDGEDIDLYDTETQELVTVTEKIQIMLATYCDDFEPTVNISKEDVKKVMGAAAMLAGVDSVSDSDKAYLVQNKLEPTISNIYIAKHAGFECGRSAVTDEEWDEMSGQAEKILINSGLTPSRENMEMCRFMLDNDIDLCKENFDRMEALSQIEPLLSEDKLIERIAANVIEGRNAKDTRLDEAKCPWESAKSVIDTVKRATEGNIMAWAVKYEKLTVSDLRKTEEQGLEIEPDEGEVRFVTARRRLTEIRLMMSLESARTIEKSGVKLDFLEINDLLEQLKKEEAKEFDAPLIDIEQTQMVLSGIDNLRSVHCAVIGSVIETKEIPSINTMQYHAEEVNARMKAAGQSYEALSTEIRTDLGDSLNRAIKESMGDILEQMGFKQNEENARAVRILVYNNLEVTEVALNQVKNIDYCVNQLFSNMTPKNVLTMIRDGINPLETDVTELNDYLAKLPVTVEYSSEKYSEFVYRMDKKGGFTEEEREKFLGIFGLVRRFENDGMKAIGSLINQGLPVTMGNLLTAYMTRKTGQIDITADENTGLSKVRDKVSYYKSLFANAQKLMTPDALEQIADGFDDMEPDDFAKALLAEESHADEQAAEKQLADLREAAEAGQDVMRFITYNEVPETISNILGAKLLIKDPAKLFCDDVREEADKLLESLNDKDEAKEEYSRLAERAKELITTDRVDIEALRRVGMGINLMNTLAQRNNYVIPFEKDNQMGIINLKIYDTGENRGSFLIRMSDITVEGKVTPDGISAQIMTNSPEFFAGDVMNGLKDAFAGEGFKETRISVNKAGEHPDMKSAAKDGVSSKRIFSAAKIFIRTIANL